MNLLATLLENVLLCIVLVSRRLGMEVLEEAAGLVMEVLVEAAGLVVEVLEEAAQTLKAQTVTRSLGIYLLEVIVLLRHKFLPHDDHFILGS